MILNLKTNHVKVVKILELFCDYNSCNVTYCTAVNTMNIDMLSASLSTSSPTVEEKPEKKKPSKTTKPTKPTKPEKPENKKPTKPTKPKSPLNKQPLSINQAEKILVDSPEPAINLKKLDKKNINNTQPFEIKVKVAKVKASLVDKELPPKREILVVNKLVASHISNLQAYSEENKSAIVDNLRSYYDRIKGILNENRGKSLTAVELNSIQLRLEQINLISGQSSSHALQLNVELRGILEACVINAFNDLKISGDKVRLTRDANYKRVLCSAFKNAKLVNLAFALLQGLMQLFPTWSNYATQGTLTTQLPGNLAVELIHCYILEIISTISQFGKGAVLTESYYRPKNELPPLPLRMFVHKSPKDFKGYESNTEQYLYYADSTNPKWESDKDFALYLKLADFKDTFIIELTTHLYMHMNVLIKPSLLEHLISAAFDPSFKNGQPPAVQNTFIKVVLSQMDNSKLGGSLLGNLLDAEFVVPEDRKTQHSIQRYGLTVNLPTEVLSLSLPMVCKPVPWSFNEVENLKGGYLSSSSSEFPKFLQDRFSLISAPSGHDCMLTVKDSLLPVMNYLQDTPFKVNTLLLGYIETNRLSLAEKGLITQPVSRNLKPSAVAEMEMAAWMKDPKKQRQEFNFAQRKKEITEEFARCNNQEYILLIANSFKDYVIYYPTSLDFRGRCYRPSLLRIQGEALGKSLLNWADNQELLDKTISNDKIAFSELLYCIAAAHSKQEYPKKGVTWALKHYTNKTFPPVNKDMEDPLLYLALTLALAAESYKYECTYKIPNRRDASSSVYQIISALTVDASLAISTNLISCPSGDDRIQDFYGSTLNDFKLYLENLLSKSEENSHFYSSLTSQSLKEQSPQSNLDDSSESSSDNDSDNESEDDSMSAGQNALVVKNEKGKEGEEDKERKRLTLFESKFAMETAIKDCLLFMDRSLIKKIVMPYSYGITILRGSHHIGEAYSKFDANYRTEFTYPLAVLLFQFIKDRLTGPHTVKTLLTTLARIAGKHDLTIKWENEFNGVSQRYFKKTTVSIVIPRNSVTKEGVCLHTYRAVTKIPTNDINVNKNCTAITANFIHSLDALIAYQMISRYAAKKLTKENNYGTVHDCFLADLTYCHLLTDDYKIAFKTVLCEPVKLINTLICKTFGISDEYITDTEIDLDFLRKELENLTIKFKAPKSQQKLVLRCNSNNFITSYSGFCNKIKLNKAVYWQDYDKSNTYPLS